MQCEQHCGKLHLKYTELMNVAYIATFPNVLLPKAETTHPIGRKNCPIVFLCRPILHEDWLNFIISHDNVYIANGNSIVLHLHKHNANVVQ